MKIQERPVATRSLYERLGSYAGITAIVEDVIAAHLASPVVGARFQKVKDIEHAKRMARDFFCAGAGGPEKYAGRDMRAAHQGMNVNEREFQAVVDDVMGVLRRHAIDDKTQQDVLAILNGFKGEIVGV
jgi:hemoglobin